MTKSREEKDFERTFKPQPRKTCNVCGSTEPYGADGTVVRYLAVSPKKWVCNYCNNQGA